MLELSVNIGSIHCLDEIAIPGAGLSPGHA